MDTRTRLRAHLRRLGWTHQQLVAWLNSLGESVSLSGVDKWFSAGGNARRCPAWPSLLIECIDPPEQRRVEIALRQARRIGYLRYDEALQIYEAGIPVWVVLGEALEQGEMTVRERCRNGELGADAVEKLAAKLGLEAFNA